MGGNVALAVAIRHPQLVRKLVTAGSHSGKIEDAYDPETLKQFKSLSPDNFAPKELKDPYDKIAPDPKKWPVLVAKIKTMDLEFKGFTPQEMFHQSSCHGHDRRPGCSSSGARRGDVSANSKRPTCSLSGRGSLSALDQPRNVAGSDCGVSGRADAGGQTLVGCGSHERNQPQICTDQHRSERMHRFGSVSSILIWRYL